MNIAKLIQNSEMVIQCIEAERINNTHLGDRANEKFDSMIAQIDALKSLIEETSRQLVSMKAAFAAEIKERDKALAAIIQDGEENAG